jgi:energy-coupling factor transport system ATP-binding protein
VSAALAVRELRCRFDDPPAEALGGVSLDVAADELVAVMGESGAGKSTLLRCINGLVPSLLPAECSGEILVGGEAVLGRRAGELAGTVAMVFQDFEAQLFSTNVRLEVAFGPGQLGVAPDEIARRVEATLALVGLDALAQRDPSTLSGGQKQRLAIASILAMRPAIMLLDEPATDLDPAGRRELYETLERLRAEHLTMIAVEHEIDPLLGADRLYLMRGGRIVAAGVPSSLAQDPDLFLACGVRPHDLAVLGRRLGRELPLAVEAAAEVLRPLLASRPRSPSPPTTPPAGATILEVERLSYSYGGPPVLRDVSLRIGAGELIALVGENGSGKTTLAKHLNGLVKAQQGTVRLGGVDLRQLSLDRVAREVGYVFQNPDHQLFADTVWDEVAFGPRNFGLDGPELAARVELALEAVGLETLREADPFLLGKGERQRLAIATVLAMRPSVLILDEPTTGLDYPQQRRVLELLRRLRQQGTTIVVITHSPWVVLEYAERALLMRDGTLIHDGPLENLLARDDLVRAAAFDLPPIARLGRALGIVARRPDDVLAALGER